MPRAELVLGNICRERGLRLERLHGEHPARFNLLNGSQHPLLNAATAAEVRDFLAMLAPVTAPERARRFIFQPRRESRRRVLPLGR